MKQFMLFVFLSVTKFNENSYIFIASFKFQFLVQSGNFCLHDSSYNRELYSSIYGHYYSYSMERFGQNNVHRNQYKYL